MYQTNQTKMAKTRRLTATFPHGEEVTRTTARTYTHVVHIFATDDQGKTTLAFNWCGRPDLKDKAVAKATKYKGLGEITVEVAKVTNDPWAE